jgi:N,N-dimethylformamidase beta subunit-like protein/flagellar hook capping protein FlgD
MKEEAADLQADRPVRREIARLVSPGALVFAALVAATVGAFFVTTRLKRSAPVVERLTFNRHFSPNGDGRLDFAVFGFRLRRTDDATVSIVTRDGDEVRTLADNRALDERRRHRFRWDGRTDSGAVAPDGEYHIRVGLRRQGRTVTTPRKLFLDTTPPKPVVRYVSPAVITPAGAGDRRGRATLRFSGPTRSPSLLVYRTDVRARSPGTPARPRLVARRAGHSGSAELRWDGMTGLGRERRPAATGSYLLAVRVRDAAGNAGPAALPPTRAGVKGHPGVEVRYLAATAPDGPVLAGEPARFRVFAAGRRYRWRARRLGSGRPVARGSSRASTLTFRAPRGRSGIAILELRVGGHEYGAPFAIQARRRRTVLVVLPSIGWQALNPVEQDGDGFPDLLPLDRRVSLARPFAGDGLPAGFLSRVAPVLLFLDRERIRYDLTSDLALARSGPDSRHRGVLFAEAERFAPARLVGLTRSYVRAGGRVAWIGTGGFSRRVSITPRTVAGGSPAPGALFGERLRVEQAPRSLVVLGDTIDFFQGVGASLGPFPAAETQLRPAQRARLLASAGPEPQRPSIAVYRLERGVVARVGVEGWGRALATSPDAGRIMRRLWTLLSR